MSSYQIQLTSKAVKDLKKLPPSLQQRITTNIRQLSTERHPPQFKTLAGHDIAQFRLRIGDYRVLYDVYDANQVVLILRIGHRRDIYR